ncbi:MAG: YbhB/YbcL family Raf kinase inhibitor-like protein [Methanoregula sp.]|nr:MAG: YbhB/YbcL family Raf kinase inhibitor-like protein [Methanoregula sp.]
MKLRVYLILMLCFISALLLCGCTEPIPSSPSPVQSQAVLKPLQTISVTGTGSFSVRVDGLVPGAVLPEAYTCIGASESPAVSWDNPPQRTKSFVLILDDPDTPAGTFTHWLVYNIPPQIRQIDRGQPNAKVLANGARSGDNSAGNRGYFPPCPPPGPAHRYVFTLYALDNEISMPTAGRDSIDMAMAGHVLGQAQAVTTFRR